MVSNEWVEDDSTMIALAVKKLSQYRGESGSPIVYLSGAIIAQIAITAFSSPDTSQLRWIVRVSVAGALIATSMSLHFSAMQHSQSKMRRLRLCIVGFLVIGFARQSEDSHSLDDELNWWLSLMRACGKCSGFMKDHPFREHSKHTKGVCGPSWRRCAWILQPVYQLSCGTLVQSPRHLLNHTGSQKRKLLCNLLTWSLIQSS